MDNNFSPIENDDHVVQVTDDDVEPLYFDYLLFKLGELSQRLNCRVADLTLGQYNSLDKCYNRYRKWIDEGVAVEILRVDSVGWQKGKLRAKVILEFCPDESESPLDEFQVKSTSSKNKAN